MNDEDRRHFLAQELNQLTVQLFALGVVGDLARLLEDFIRLWVREA